MAHLTVEAQLDGHAYWTDNTEVIRLVL